MLLNLTLPLTLLNWTWALLRKGGHLQVQVLIHFTLYITPSSIKVKKKLYMSLYLLGSVRAFIFSRAELKEPLFSPEQKRKKLNWRKHGVPFLVCIFILILAKWNPWDNFIELWYFGFFCFFLWFLRYCMSQVLTNKGSKFWFKFKWLPFAFSLKRALRSPTEVAFADHFCIGGDPKFVSLCSYDDRTWN